MTSNKVQKHAANLSMITKTGRYLTARSGGGYCIIRVWNDLEAGEQKEESTDYATLDALEAGMRQIEPDLRKWKTGRKSIRNVKVW